MISQSGTRFQFYTAARKRRVFSVSDAGAARGIGERDLGLNSLCQGRRPMDFAWTLQIIACVAIVVIAIFKSHRAVIIGMYNWNCSHRHRQTAQTATSKFRAGKRFARFADGERLPDDRRQPGLQGRRLHAKRCCRPDRAASGRASVNEPVERMAFDK